MTAGMKYISGLKRGTLHLIIKDYRHNKSTDPLPNDGSSVLDETFRDLPETAITLH